MLKAIETVYKGYKFRSRLEARWAVFFDALGITWEYEKEGYDLDGVWYLPDFWLPEWCCFIEIKGQYPTSEEYQKALKLAYASENDRGIAKDVFIFWGNIGVPAHNTEGGELWELANSGFRGGAIGVVQSGEWEDRHERSFCSCFVWAECSECHRLTIRDSCGTVHRCSDIRCKACLGAKIDSPKLKAAYTAARQARFEHGEKGV